MAVPETPKSFWRFYGSLFLWAITEAYSATDRVLTGVAVLTFIATLVSKELGRQITIRWQGLSRWWSLAPILALVGYRLLRANYAHFEAIVHKFDAATLDLSTTRAELEEAKKNSKPDLQLSIRRVWIRVTSLSRLTGDLMKGMSKLFDRPDLAEPSQPFDVYIQFYMTNGTQAATTIQQYQLTVGPHNQRVIGSYFKNLKGETLPIEYTGFDSTGERRPVVDQEPLTEDFAEQLNSVPIEYCKGRLGWLRFSCSGIEPEAVKLANVTLVAIDALGIGHEAKIEPNAQLKLEHLDI